MTDQNHALDQARAQFDSIVAMVAALSVDYERLEELRDARDDADSAAEWSAANPEDAAELAELEAAAGDCTSEDDARERIQQDPLSVEVRADWHAVGETPDPSEFCILLCTGGPAVRILGELDDGNEPSRAYMQYQDWGTPWTDFTPAGSRDALLTYCRQFYFGG